jgi:phosphate transport system substrate-binding protein
VSGRGSRLALVAAAALVLFACPYTVAQEFVVDGSSTLHPVLSAVAESFRATHPDAAPTVRFSGTGVGFELLCSGQVDLIGASRPIDGDETGACSAAGIDPVELPLAFDRITVVVNPANDWVDCLTLDELGRLWRRESTVRRWSDLRPTWPASEISLYAPSVASGTYDLFAAAVLAGGGTLRTDFFPSEDDAMLARRVGEDRDGMSFFGHGHYLAARGSLRPVAIDGGDGCVQPGLPAHVPANPPPLWRTLFMYASGEALRQSPAVAEFAELALSGAGRLMVEEAGYLPLDSAARRRSLELLEAARTAEPKPADGD